MPETEINKFISRQARAIALQRFYRNNPLAIPSTSKEQTRIDREIWQQIVWSGRAKEVYEKVKRRAAQQRHAPEVIK